MIGTITNSKDTSLNYLCYKVVTVNSIFTNEAKIQEFFKDLENYFTSNMEDIILEPCLDDKKLVQGDHKEKKVSISQCTYAYADLGLEICFVMGFKILRGDLGIISNMGSFFSFYGT